MRIAPALASVLAIALAGCGAVPDAKQSSRPRTSTGDQASIGTNPKARQCLAELGKVGSQFSPIPDKYYGAGCSTLNTVRLEAIAGDKGSLGVTNLTTVACPIANAFASWARYGADRAARQILGSALVRIETMGSYSCRNVAGTSRRSAHSRAEAIDIAAFVLADGRRISVLGGWNASKSEREFLRTVHDSACKRFGTVLGPEYNAAHRDHLHLEYGGGNFCR